MTPPPRVYRTQVDVVKIGTTGTVEVRTAVNRAFPRPLHTAIVKRFQGGFQATFPTIHDAAKVWRPTLESCLEEAGRIVGTVSGMEQQRFNPAQRYVMGQQRCPRIMSGGTLCNLRPDIGSVWCEHHKGGR